MAMLMEEAGGAAVTDKGERILDILPKGIHDKSGIWLGSKGEIERFLELLVKLISKPLINGYGWRYEPPGIVS